MAGITIEASFQVLNWALSQILGCYRSRELNQERSNEPQSTSRLVQWECHIFRDTIEFWRNLKSNKIWEWISDFLQGLKSCKQGLCRD
jgi:hypothetical protein